MARTVRTAIDWLERRGRQSDPFLLWLDLFSPHGPWDPPQPYRDQYATVEPDEFEAGEEGDLVEDADEDEEIDIEDVPVLIDVPAGAVGDVLDEAELFRLRRTYAGHRHPGGSLAGRAVRGPAARWAGWTTPCSIFTSDQGEPLGEHGYVRRFRPWLYEELIHTPLIDPHARRQVRRRPAPGAGADGGPAADDPRGARRAAGDDHQPIHGHDLLPLIRGEQTKVRDYACLGMDVEEFAIRTHLWHLIVPVVSDPDEPRVHRALSQARGPLGPEQRDRAASRGGRPPGASAAALCRGPRPRCARGPGSSPRDRAVRGSMSPARTGLGAAPGSSWPGAMP